MKKKPEEEKVKSKVIALAYEFGTKKDYDETHFLITPFVDEIAKKEVYLARTQNILEDLDIGLLHLYDDVDHPSIPLSQVLVVHYQNNPVYQVCKDIRATSFFLGDLPELLNTGYDQEWKSKLDSVWQRYIESCPK